MRNALQSRLLLVSDRSISFFRHLAGGVARETGGAVAVGSLGALAVNPTIAACATAIFVGYLLKDALAASHSKLTTANVERAQTLLETSLREQRDLALALAGLEKGEIPAELPPHFPITVIRQNACDLREALEAARMGREETQAALERLESLNVYMGRCIDENFAGVRDALDRIEAKIDEIAQRLLAQNELLTRTNAQLVGMLAGKEDEIRKLKADLRAFMEAKGEAALDRVREPAGQAELIAFLEARADEDEARAIKRRRRAAYVAYLIGDIAAAERNITRILGLAPDDLHALNLLGRVRWLQGKFDEAQGLCQRVWESAPNDGWRAIALGNLGIIEKRRGNLGAAENYYKHSLGINEKLGHKEGMANNLGSLGAIEQTRGKFDTAENYYKRSLAINEELGRKEGMAIQFGNLGVIERTRGNLDAAEDYHKRSLAIDESLGRKEGMAIQFGNLGVIELTRGNLDAAEDYHKRSLVINEDLGCREGMADNLGNLGIIESRRGNLNGAEDYYKRSFAINEELGRKEGMAADLGNLGVIEWTRGNLDTAEDYHKRSLAIAEEMGDKRTMAINLGNLGNIEQSRGNLEAAEDYLKRSFAINEEVGCKEGMANQLGNLGGVARMRGDCAEARRLGEQALALYKQIGMPHSVERIQGCLDALPDE